jgi:hypothetical protein
MLLIYPYRRPCVFDVRPSTDTGREWPITIVKNLKSCSTHLHSTPHISSLSFKMRRPSVYATRPSQICIGVVEEMLHAFLKAPDESEWYVPRSSSIVILKTVPYMERARGWVGSGASPDVVFKAKMFTPDGNHYIQQCSHLRYPNSSCILACNYFTADRPEFLSSGI